MCCETCAEHVEERDADLNKLVDLANVLDEKGLTAEANLVDSLIVEAKKKKDEKKKDEKKKKEDKKEDKKEKKEDKKGKKPFWLQKKKAELVKLADTLDEKGLTAEADVLDAIIKEDLAEVEVPVAEAPVTVEVPVAAEAPVAAPVEVHLV